MLSPGLRQPISVLHELRRDKLPASDINANFLPKINYLYRATMLRRPSNQNNIGNSKIN